MSLISVEPTCSDDLLLYFPYDVNFDDVTCHHAKGYAYGDGKATIVNDVDRGNVVHFDGNVRIEVIDYDSHHFLLYNVCRLMCVRTWIVVCLNVRASMLCVCTKVCLRFICVHLCVRAEAFACVVVCV